MVLFLTIGGLWAACENYREISTSQFHR